MRRGLWWSAVSIAAALTWLGAEWIGSPESSLQARVPSAHTGVRRACAMDEDMVARIWRGYDPARSEDVVLVPTAPDYIGEPTIPSHTGPWDYVQEVPLVVYGPPYVRAGGNPI